MMRSKESAFLLSYYPGSLQDLPLISPVAGDWARVAHRRALTFDELALAFQTDIFLCAKVVSVANSIFFNTSHLPCFTIEEALLRVGHDFATALLKNAVQIAEPEARESARKLWKHCLATACIAKALQPHAKNVRHTAAAVYWSSMVHDIGFLIEANFERDRFAEVLNSFHDREVSSDEHCVLAQGLAHYWALPPWVKELLRWHHAPDACADDEVAPLINLLHISHSIADFGEEGIAAEKIAIAGLDPDGIARVVEHRRQLLADLEALHGR